MCGGAYRRGFWVFVSCLEVFLFFQTTGGPTRGHTNFSVVFIRFNVCVRPAVLFTIFYNGVFTEGRGDLCFIPAIAVAKNFFFYTAFVATTTVSSNFVP